MILLTSILKLRQVVEADGIQRADVTLHRNAQIVHLGTVGPRGEIGLAFLVDDADLPMDANGAPLQVPKENLVQLEFLIIGTGTKFPEGYQYRAAVLTAQGMLFLFEKVDANAKPRGRILIPTGRGVG